jgi:hypothetical protein
VNELRRLNEQLDLQHLARMKVLSSTFNLNFISDLQCLQRYRFTRKDIRFLADLIPWGKRLDHEGRMRTSQKRYLVDPVEATAITLRRLATASRWVDMESEFGKHRSALSEIFIMRWSSSIANSDRLWKLGQRVLSRCVQGSMQSVWRIRDLL